jgi:hypothetical protein
MEDVLDLYSQEASPAKARICFDERPCQLLEDGIAPLPMQPGKLKKEDYEYKRKGTGVILLAYDIDTGQRYVETRKQRTKQDYAEFMENLISQHYRHVEQVELVQDNLNTHSYGSFYEHLPAAQARDLTKKINFHFTPKHGSWLNMAEIEFSVMSRECLSRRIGCIEELEKEVLSWSQSRNKQAARIHWSFTVCNARQKLERQYAKVNENNTVSKN